MGNKKNPKSFEIALSGISCAVAVIFLSIGILSDFLLGTGYFVGILAMMVPLSKQFYRGGALAYAGTVILTLLLGAIAKAWDLVPFAMFLGLHPLVNALQKKYNINKWLAFVVKAVWFDFMLIVGYYLVFGGVMGGNLLPEKVYEIINTYIWAIVFTVGTLCFFIYDHLIFKCQIAVNLIVNRIRR